MTIQTDCNYNWRIQKTVKAQNTNCMARDFYLIFFFCICIALGLKGQEQLGMRLENYAGIWAAGTNPANVVFDKNKWDIGLFSGGLYMQNNAFYLENGSAIILASNYKKIKIDVNTDLGNNANKLLIKYTQPKGNIDFNSAIKVEGPSFSYKIADYLSVGLVTSSRFNISSFDVPKSIKLDEKQEVDKYIGTVIEPFKGAALSWSELGIHASLILDEEGSIAIGCTPKLLFGHEAAYVNTLRSTWALSQDSCLYYAGNWNLGFTEGNLQDNTNYRFQNSGYGFGIDIGASIILGKGVSNAPYKWKLGFSILDLGAVKFKKQSSNYTIVLDEYSHYTSKGLNDANDPISTIKRFRNELSSDSANQVNYNGFSIATPTALSLQVDRHIFNNLFAGFVLFQRIPLGNKNIHRANTLALSPRYEHKAFAISIPVVVNEWQNVRLGIAARIGWLTLGSDHITSVFKNKPRQFGTDFYFAFKINQFSLRGSRNSGKKSDKILCPEF